MIQRKIEKHIRRVAACYPVVTITGPRQSGKTTLARALFPDYEYQNLEAADILMVAKSDPRSFLGFGEKRMVIDEVQRFPELLTYIQEIVDRRKEKGQFVVTGSHQPALNAAVNESLAGRTGVCELLPFSLEELERVIPNGFNRDECLWRGFMPRHYDDGIDPVMLYRDYFRTYVERDVRMLVNIQDLDSFTVFMRLLAGRTGQLLNKESLARDVGVSVPTVLRWLNVLEASYVIHRLRPYHNNFGKRQTKSPKIYFTDVGLATYLLGIRETAQLATHPLVGALFENMVVMEAVKNRLNAGEEPDLWFYRNSSGSIEVDLLIEQAGRLKLREVKCSATYHTDMSRHLAQLSELAENVDSALVVYSGETHPGVAVNFGETELWM